jgi:hypothetical protein
MRRDALPAAVHADKLHFDPPAPRRKPQRARSTTMSTHEITPPISGEAALRLTGLRWLRAIGWVLYTLAVIAGAVYGYRFGFALSGMPFGLLTAALTALFCSILADAAIGRLTRRR